MDDTKHKAGQDSENCEYTTWTWRDTLSRIQHIDTIIEKIVSGAILLNAGLLAAFSTLNTILVRLPPEYAISVRWAMIGVSMGGFIINVLLAKNLARQEYFRQWYYRIFPDRLPLKPHKEWPEKNISNNYCMDYMKQGDEIKKAESRKILCWLGKRRPGYCESWFIILLFMALVFLWFVWSSCPMIAILISGIALTTVVGIGILTDKDRYIMTEKKR